MFVEERFRLPEEYVKTLHDRPVPWGFGSLSETVYHRTYSRAGEVWPDTIVRTVEGVMSIRKDWYLHHVGRKWDETRWQAEAELLADAMFEMRLLPPGRGLWAMGTEYVYERGSHALNNCGAVAVEDTLSRPATWLMDSLMVGVGVGFTTNTARLGKFVQPTGDFEDFVIEDSKEGWVDSLRKVILAYETPGQRPIRFDYSAIRPKGAAIHGFGGVSGGPAPLRKLHKRAIGYMNMYANGLCSQTRLIADMMNAIGSCVVSGNVRRSAELAVGSPYDEEFLSLKDYKVVPEREEIGRMSNNSVALSSREDFDMLPDLADRIRDNGEPGILNMINVRKFGRSGERMHDDAVGINPCGEIPLESNELCNLVEVFPTRCRSTADIYETMRLGTLYVSTVSLLRSQSAETNEVVTRNRRVGVSVSGIADWLDATSVSNVFGILNRGYEEVVRPTNKKLAAEAGVPASIRVTTVKPSGTVSLLAGVSSGMHFPIGGYVLRRIRVAGDSPLSAALAESGVPNEPDIFDAGTNVFEFPLRYGAGRTRSVHQVSVFEQAAIVAMLQRAWADNAVSNTLTVQPEDMKHIERVLSLYAPLVKSMSMLPGDNTAYAQLPIERITKAEHAERAAKLSPVDWSGVQESADPENSRYCSNDTCEVP